MGRNSGDMSGADIAFNFMRGAEMVGQGLQRSQQLEAHNMEMEDERGVRAAYEQFASAVGQNGDISALEGSPLLNTRHGVMAMGKFMADRASSEQARLSMLQNMAKADDALYQEYFRPLAMSAQDAYRAGDMQRFGQLAGKLSEIAPFPYKYQMGQDGSFTELFRSTADGGFVDSGHRMNPQQVMDAITGIMSGEQNILSGMDMQTRTVNPNFLAAAARYKMGTIMGNAQALADPKQWIPLTKGGKTIWAVPQNRHDDYSAEPAYRIVDDGGKMGGMADSLNSLMSQGWTRADVEADLTRKRRLVAGGGMAGGMGATASDEVMTDTLLRAGYVYDKNYKRWFKGREDMDGKPQPDYSQPLSREEYQKLAGLMSGEDPLGYLGGMARGYGNASEPTAGTAQGQVGPGPVLPKTPHGTARNNAGQLIMYSQNGVTQWAILGDDGKPQNITPEEAKAYSAKMSSTKQAPSRRAREEVTVSDVWDQLSPEEQAHWQQTGKLPSRYSQVR